MRMNSLLPAAIGLLLATGCNSTPAQTSASTESKPPAPSAEATTAVAAPSAAPSTIAVATAEVAATSAAPPPPAPPADLPAPADVATPPPGASKTASGLVSKVLKPGTAKDHPKTEDTVKVHYTGWTKDGKMFDSSVTRGEPTSFRLNQVIKGWTEGVALMVKGEKRRFWIPGALAYGDHPRAGAPAGDLVFDVELLDITVAPKPHAVPEDVKAPSASAKKTASGLAYRIVKKGTGTRSPKATDRVTVNYTGWTTDGKMFDSSAKSGGPTSFQLDHVIKGWTEGLQLAHEGDTLRLWIPADLAYGNKPTRPGAPVGMLVFDIDVISIP